MEYILNQLMICACIISKLHQTTKQKHAIVVITGTRHVVHNIKYKGAMIEVAQSVCL